VFDEVTERLVRDTQQFWGLTVDGRVGRQTWATIDWLAGL
jgi:peptidoglycan hydrolase-like protein with peptidoglycan-binding domain